MTNETTDTTNYLPNQSKGKILALAGAIILHGGIAAWAMAPGDPVQMQPQVIKISMVMPSSIEAQKKVDPKPEPKPIITPPKKNGVKPKKQEVQKHPQEPVKEEKKQAAQTPQTSGPVAVDAVDKTAAKTEPLFNAAYLHNPAPAYPESARKRGKEGKVILAVEVNADGAAKNVSIQNSSGLDVFDEAAMKAVRNWKFVPAKQGAESVEARVLVPIEFKLN